MLDHLLDRADKFALYDRDNQGFAPKDLYFSLKRPIFFHENAGIFDKFTLHPGASGNVSG
jgi:hypothetical protein